MAVGTSWQCCQAAGARQAAQEHLKGTAFALQPQGFPTSAASGR